MQKHTVQVNLSHRHIHITDEDVATLFGPNTTLTPKTHLLQPGQYAAEETVSISGPAGSIEKVRVVGPTRADTQCEILTGDCYTLGLKITEVPVRLSGNIADSASFTITGPAGTMTKKEGLIIAQRHIHIDPTNAASYSLSDGQVVDIRLTTPHKQLTLHDTVVRVSETSVLECHIDIEEGNAAGIGNGHEAEIVP